MERLTFDGLFCDIAKCKETPGGTFCEDGACSQRKVWERLKEYEDTGLEPEQVSELKGFIQGGIHKVDDGWAHVQELLDAEKAGHLVVLPCKVGDTVYCVLEDSPVYYPETDGWYISEETVHEITTKGLILQEVEDGASVYVELFDKIGKTVFLTREEAERALEGQK